jgi:L-alanine-DL-glutamate epimerase-like enolase superfamily enzyme
MFGLPVERGECLLPAQHAFDDDPDPLLRVPLRLFPRLPPGLFTCEAQRCDFRGTHRLALCRTHCFFMGGTPGLGFGFAARRLFAEDERKDMRDVPRIAEVRTIGLRRERDSRVDSRTNYDTLVEVRTDSGLVGYGSCYTSRALVDAAFGLLHDDIIGEVAIEPERVSEKLHQKTFWTGRGGSVTHAISGLDIALWDILGKHTGQPVGRLLGGRYRDRVTPYASLIWAEPARLRDILQAAMSRGFRAFKLGWGPFGRVSDAYDEQLMRTARETVGDAGELMVDVGASQEFWPQGLKWALRTADMLARFGVVWLEEPLPPDDIDGYRELRRQSRVRISGGEVLTRRQSFRSWLESGAFDVVQPDSTKVGGLSEARRIGWLAQEHNVLLVPHGFNTGVGLAADLQLVSALPNAKYVEYITPAAQIEEILKVPFKLDPDGTPAVPDAPGLGIAIDPEGVAGLALAE